MYIEILKCKIHRATVTDTGLNYVGSITISEDIMKKVNLKEVERDLAACREHSPATGHDDDIQ